jgi:flagella basal body P-ring formation protein FlgA
MMFKVAAGWLQGRVDKIRYIYNIGLLVLLIAPLGSWAQTKTVQTNPEPDSSWTSAIDASIAELTKFAGMSTAVSYPDRMPKWPPCKQPRAIPGTGSSTTGKFPVSLRCDSPRWLGQIVVTVEAAKRHLVAARNLQAGVIISPSDIVESESDWTKLPDDVATDAEQLLGRTLTRAMQQGQALTLNFARQTAVIRTGERVRVQMVGSNFTVTGDGLAVQQGAVGESVKVKMASGQFVTATVVRSGVVELKLE